MFKLPFSIRSNDQAGQSQPSDPNDPGGRPDDLNPSRWTGVEPLEERVLLAADLAIDGLQPPGNPVPPGDPSRALLARPTFQLGGSRLSAFAPGEPFAAGFALQNFGDQPIDNIRIGFYIDVDEDFSNGARLFYVHRVGQEVPAFDPMANMGMGAPGEVAIGNIGDNGQLNGGIEMAMPPDLPYVDGNGFPINYHLFIVADPDLPVFNGVSWSIPLGGTIGENDETNNVSDGITLPFAFSTRDIVGANIDLPDISLWAGGTFDLEYTIRNVGAVNTGPFSVTFYLDKAPGPGVFADFNDTNPFGRGDPLGGGFNPNDTNNVFLGRHEVASGMNGTDSRTRVFTFTLPDPDHPFWNTGRQTDSVNAVYRIGYIINEANDPFVDNNDFTQNNRNIGYDGSNLTYGGLQSFQGMPNIVKSGLNVDQNGVLVENYYDLAPIEISVYPDLSAANIHIDETDLEPGQTTAVSVDILNNSKIPAFRGMEDPINFPLRVGFYLSTDGVITSEDALIGTFNLPSPFDNANRAADTPTDDPFIFSIENFEVTLPDNDDPFWIGLEDGQFFIGVLTIIPVLDGNNFEFPIRASQADGDMGQEGNIVDNGNIAQGVDYDAVDVSNVLGGPDPDAIVDVAVQDFDIRIDATKVRTDDKDIKVMFRVANLGTDPATNVRVGLYLSADSNIGLNDLRIGEVIVPNIDGGDTTDLIEAIATLPDVNQPFWGGPGAYYVGAFADDFDVINEPNENNNANRGMGIDFDSIDITLVGSQDNRPDNTPNKGPHLGTAQGVVPPAVVLPNGSFKPVSQGRAFGSVGPDDPVDWYRVYLPRAARLKVVLDARDGNANLLLRRFQPPALLGQTQRVKGLFEVLNKWTSKGLHFIKVTALGNQVTSYALMVSADYSAANGAPAAAKSNTTTAVNTSALTATLRTNEVSIFDDHDSSTASIDIGDGTEDVLALAGATAHLR